MKNPTARVARQGSDWKSFPASSKTDHATIPYSLSTDIEIDVVSVLVARSGVAAATVRAHVEAFRIGGRQ